MQWGIVYNLTTRINKTGTAFLTSTYFQLKKNNCETEEVLKQQLKDDFLGE